MSSSSMGAVDMVTMPCSADDAAAKKTGLRLCSVVQAEAIANVQQRILQQAQGYYNGNVLDAKVDSSGATTQVSCVGASFPAGVCNYFGDKFGGTFNNGAVKELNTTNWPTARPSPDPTGMTPIQQSCGSKTHFDTRISGSTCQITPNITRKDDPNYPWRKEDAFTKGLIIHSFNCHWAQVKNDLLNNKLTLTGVGGTPGVCAQLAKKFSSQATSWNQSFQSNLGAQANIFDQNNCTSTGGTTTDANNPDLGRNRQSACQLQAARTALESNFNYLAFCEVLLRSENSYAGFISQNTSGQTLYDQARQVLNSQNIQGSSSQCNENNIYNRYWSIYTNLFETRANAIWNDSVCQ